MKTAKVSAEGLIGHKLDMLADRITSALHKAQDNMHNALVTERQSIAHGMLLDAAQKISQDNGLPIPKRNCRIDLDLYSGLDSPDVNKPEHQVGTLMALIEIAEAFTTDSMTSSGWYLEGGHRDTPIWQWGTSQNRLTTRDNIRLRRVLDNGATSIDMGWIELNNSPYADIVRKVLTKKQAQDIERHAKASKLYGYLEAIDAHIVRSCLEESMAPGDKPSAKAFARTVRKNTSISLPPEVVSEIGNQINLLYGEGLQDEVWVDVTTDFNWQAGDFGDEGSCFWASHSGSKDVIRKLGGFAIRTWTKEPNDNLEGGHGRCWAIPVGSSIVLFNAYPRNVSLEAMGQAAAALFPHLTNQLRVRLNSDDIYINSSAGLVMSSDKQDTVSLYVTSSFIEKTRSLSANTEWLNQQEQI